MNQTSLRRYYQRAQPQSTTARARKLPQKYSDICNELEKEAEKLFSKEIRKLKRNLRFQEENQVDQEKHVCGTFNMSYKSYDYD